MAEVIFYEKPGCINNTKQKQLLREAGHQVEARNLLTEAWSRESLRAFFADLPVAEWFNRSAPSVRDGWVIPETMGEERALNLMLAEPILIRRPLVQVGEERRVGFDMAAVDAWIGLEGGVPAADLESCPREQGHRCD